MITTDAIRKASLALNAVFNAEQVHSIIIAAEHLLDGYVRQVTAPPLPPSPEPTPEEPRDAAGNPRATVDDENTIRSKKTKAKEA